MKTVRRDACVLTAEHDLEHLFAFIGFPIFMGCTEEPVESDLFIDMEWHISRGSGCIQLPFLVPLEQLYPASRASGVVGKLWFEHHQALARFIQQFPVDSVLEVGGGHGILSREFMRENKNVSWTILEPNPKPAEGVTATYINTFFDKDFVLEKTYSAIVLSHVLEHFYDPMEFVRTLAKALNPGRLVFIAVPNFRTWLERRDAYNLNFEHNYLLLPEYLDYMFAANGFVREACEPFQDDHSVFYAYRKVSDCPQKPSSNFQGLYEKNKSQYLQYTERYTEKVKSLNARLAATQRPVYLFCAHAFNQYLLAYGLDTAKIRKMLDNDPQKHGKRFYGTILQIDSARCLASEKNPVVLLDDSAFSQEIKQDILENINPHTEFWS